MGSVTISEIDETNKTITGTFSAEIPLPYHGAKMGVYHGSFNRIPFIPFSTEPPRDNNSFSVKVDGVNLNATPTISSYYAHNYYELTTMHFLTSEHQISISIFDYVGKDAYRMFSDNISPKAYYKAGEISFSQPSGKVTITLHNMVTRRMEGSFNFSAEPEDGGPIVNVEGSFAFNY